MNSLSWVNAPGAVMLGPWTADHYVDAWPRRFPNVAPPDSPSASQVL